MVDWQGLFQWSVQNHANRAPKDFKELSAEDRNWLDDAIKSYTYYEADRMQQLCRSLSNKNQSDQDLIKLLKELHEIIQGE